ncbi:MAG: hypothetical protein B7Y47_12650 [Sphingomonas sp. 28-63-12]|nr:MAG: hypothetical protein B7Y47_12650 [Sphingomonas sp. 28-63-12]
MGAGRSIVASLIEADGSHKHAMLVRLMAPQVPVRDIADAIHALCMLHGRQPGIIDHAFARNSQPAAQGWLEVALEGFAVERAFLAKLASAAGPLPSTPGQAESEAAVVGQRHALDMLAQSDRTGCAIGAAVALVIDWSAMRQVLNVAAHRFGIEPPGYELPLPAETETIVVETAENPAVERAMAFGVQQVLAQHRGLWDLLEARASARDRH